MTQIMTQAIENVVFPRGLCSTEYGSSPVSRTKALKTLSFQGFSLFMNLLESALFDLGKRTRFLAVPKGANLAT